MWDLFQALRCGKGRKNRKCEVRGSTWSSTRAGNLSFSRFRIIYVLNQITSASKILVDFWWWLINKLTAASLLWVRSAYLINLIDLLWPRLLKKSSAFYGIKVRNWCYKRTVGRGALRRDDKYLQSRLVIKVSCCSLRVLFLIARN